MVICYTIGVIKGHFKPQTGDKNANCKGFPQKMSSINVKLTELCRLKTQEVQYTCLNLIFTTFLHNRGH